MAERLPSDIARETLKQLVVRRLPPTPENYQALYEEIAGHRSPAQFPDGPLRNILRVVPGQTPAQKRLLGLFESAVAARDWSALQSVLVGYANLGLNPASASASFDLAGTPTPLSCLPDALAEQMARVVENTLTALESDDAQVHILGNQLVQFLRQPSPPASTLQPMLGNFSYQLAFATEDQAAIRGMLLQLLHMVFQNIAALSDEDSWLQGQAEALITATEQPISLRRLDDVQRRLKNVILKQTEAKGRMVETQGHMKQMLSTFIERLSAMTETSSTYHEKMEHCAGLFALLGAHGFPALHATTGVVALRRW